MSEKGQCNRRDILFFDKPDHARSGGSGRPHTSSEAGVALWKALQVNERPRNGCERRAQGSERAVERTVQGQWKGERKTVEGTVERQWKGQWK